MDWLGDNREEAGEKYEEIRVRLINFFSWRGRSNPEDLADQVINIVVGKLPQLAREYEGDPVRYFLGVARTHVKKKDLRSLESPVSPELKTNEENIEELLIKEVTNNCYRKCFDELSNTHKNLITRYYKNGGKQDNGFRKKFAVDNDMSFEALRVTISRIRSRLNQCLKKCTEEA